MYALQEYILVALSQPRDVEDDPDPAEMDVAHMRYTPMKLFGGSLVRPAACRAESLICLCAFFRLIRIFRASRGM